MNYDLNADDNGTNPRRQSPYSQFNPSYSSSMSSPPNQPFVHQIKDGPHNARGIHRPDTPGSHGRTNQFTTMSSSSDVYQSGWQYSQDQQLNSRGFGLAGRLSLYPTTLDTGSRHFPEQGDAAVHSTAGSINSWPSDSYNDANEERHVVNARIHESSSGPHFDPSLPSEWASNVVIQTGEVSTGINTDTTESMRDWSASGGEEPSYGTDFNK
ncbi:hypothetical protein K469DRAFT_685705 [Zopfia rhizophila CBS 207.26]|uniref:Uncharacterized protein n=1 Tax=Zopfia rhizophila CBS 207.26 TaxID=1314779 RepID=A0A6A6EDE5_9PEZI|nr:hypothetical protein K469DRAFT_685705 [Zopfia rhizophila CBS 207.26]